MNSQFFSLTISEIENLVKVEDPQNKVFIEAYYNLSVLHGSYFHEAINHHQQIQILSSNQNGQVARVHDGTQIYTVLINNSVCICNCDVFQKLQQKIRQGIYCKHILEGMIELQKNLGTNSNIKSISDQEYVEILDEML